MPILTEINKVENELIDKYRELKVWDEMMRLDRERLARLVAKNYLYSSQFPNFLATAHKNAITYPARVALEHIVRDENVPDEHLSIHTRLVNACEIDVSAITREPHPPIERLVSRSMAMANPKDERDELQLLCFFRLGSEILTGFLYRALRETVPVTFSLDEHACEFIELHAEHDCKSTDLGIMPGGTPDQRGSYPHADRFNSPITSLSRSIGDDALALAQSAFQEAYELRKEYVEYLVA